MKSNSLSSANLRETCESITKVSWDLDGNEECVMKITYKNGEEFRQRFSSVYAAKSHLLKSVAPGWESEEDIPATVTIFPY